MRAEKTWHPPPFSPKRLGTSYHGRSLGRGRLPPLSASLVCAPSVSRIPRDSGSSPVDAPRRSSRFPFSFVAVTISSLRGWRERPLFCRRREGFLLFALHQSNRLCGGPFFFIEEVETFLLKCVFLQPFPFFGWYEGV